MGGVEEALGCILALGSIRGKEMRLYLKLLVSATFVLSMWVSSAYADKRLALLIGNKNYAPLVGPLKNPHNDVDLVAKALKKDNFEVVIIKDASRRDIAKAINQFASKLSGADKGAVGFFYYSGHGVSRPEDRVNYIIPVDVKSMDDPNVWWDAISLDSILMELERIAPNAAHFVVFDACRRELRVPTKSPIKGFVAEPDRNGIFVAFSTSPNDVASDLGEESGPYAAMLASELSKMGQDNLSLFQNVKERVFTATNNRQRPWENNGLLQRFYFAGKVQEVPKSDQAKQAWEWVKLTTDTKILENFVSLYGDTEEGGLAKRQLEQLRKDTSPASAPPFEGGQRKTPPSKIVLSIAPNSPIYSRGDMIKIKIIAASNLVKAFAVFPFGPQERSKVEASFSIAEGGLYIPYRIPPSTKAGPYSIPVYVQEINSKLEEKQLVDIEIRG
jgi:uncharacterized caspase-like protein